RRCNPLQLQRVAALTDRVGTWVHQCKDVQQEAASGGNLRSTGRSTPEVGCEKAPHPTGEHREGEASCCRNLLPNSGPRPLGEGPEGGSAIHRAAAGL